MSDDDKKFTQEEFDTALAAKVAEQVKAEVDKTAAKIRAEERKKVTEQFADYDDLKKAAEGAKTDADRIAELEKSIAQANHETLRRRVQAKHGLSDEDADLYLTGADEKSLTAQAEGLAARSAERKKQGNRSPREGNIPPGGGKDDAMREFTRGLFASAAGD